MLWASVVREAVHHHDDEMGWIRIDNNKMTWCC
jgi:hypothetical protein